MRIWPLAILVCVTALTCRSIEVLPAVPVHYFNDYAGVVSVSTATQLENDLAQFDRVTSTQIVVAIYPTMTSDSSLEDFTHRTLESWKIGRAGKDNGVGFFVFVAERTARIEVNYGLEGALPDATCKRILEEEVLPRFREKDFDSGVRAGVAALERATKGEYTSTERSSITRRGKSWAFFAYFMPVLLILFVAMARRRGGAGHVYDRSGRQVYRAGLFVGLLSLLFGGRGPGGGGMFGGGGSGGGGGASGRW